MKRQYSKEELEALPFRPSKDMERKKAEWKRRLSESKRRRDARKRLKTEGENDGK